MSSWIFPLSAIGAKVLSREPIAAGVGVSTSAGQREYRQQWATTKRVRYRVGFDVLRPDTRQDYQQLVGMFDEHFGQFDSFLLVDEVDNSVTDHGFGVGDGTTTTFQLQRSLLAARKDATGGPWARSSKPRTNLLLQSSSFDNASWTKTGGTPATVTANAAYAPDGTLTAEQIAGSSAASAQVRQVTTANAPSGTFTFSVWLRTGFGTDTATLRFLTADGSGVLTSTTAPLSTTWTRATLTATYPASPAGVARVDFAASGGGTIYAWGAQLETGTSPTAYIATTTATVTASPSYWPAFGDGFEPIYDPDVASVTIYANGSAQTPGTNYTLSSTGVVTWVGAPSAGTVLSWSGSYWRRVRFANPSLPLSRIVQSMWSADGLELLSVF